MKRREMKDNIVKLFYASEGFCITLVGYHWFEQTLLPIVVAAVGAFVTVLIQHYLKKYLDKREKDAARYKQNGKK